MRWLSLPVVKLSSVAAMVQEDTTAVATNPVFTECLAVIYISDVCTSAMYLDRPQEKRDMSMANAAPMRTMRP
ncbi:hypothetical protein IWX46DRAFT_298921 [Phyllosticta citricarpa]|uniref:Secreted protein n=1 Tax=Phyllosticta citricarpa TaxID=55181 RepID=A0ABR1MMV0_9PEZI